MTTDCNKTYFKMNIWWSLVLEEGVKYQNSIPWYNLKYEKINKIKYRSLCLLGLNIKSNEDEIEALTQEAKIKGLLVDMENGQTRPKWAKHALAGPLRASVYRHAFQNTPKLKSSAWPVNGLGSLVAACICSFIYLLSSSSSSIIIIILLFTAKLPLWSVTPWQRQQKQR